jgi:hypothetical protein
VVCYGWMSERGTREGINGRREKGDRETEVIAVGSGHRMRWLVTETAKWSPHIFCNQMRLPVCRHQHYGGTTQYISPFLFREGNPEHIWMYLANRNLSISMSLTCERS